MGQNPIHRPLNPYLPTESAKHSDLRLGHPLPLPRVLLFLQSAKTLSIDPVKPTYLLSLQYTVTSVLGTISCTTSAFTRLNMKGFNTACNLASCWGSTKAAGEEVVAAPSTSYNSNSNDAISRCISRGIKGGKEATAATYHSNRDCSTASGQHEGWQHCL